MTRLRRADCSGPGLRRRRAGRGWAYYDDEGNHITDPDVVARIAELAIPPAWQDVWICPYPNGHLQAIGVDAKGRRQYRYHDAWRLRRDLEKFDEMLSFARALPAVRERVELELTASDALTRERVLACAVRLLDRGFFRIGSEDYAVQNETYGLATMKKEHVTLGADYTMVFDYPAKHGRRRVQSVVDPAVFEVVARLKRRRSGIDELLAYQVGREWVDVRSADINAYLKEITGGDFSAKDFRTWNATVLAAVALAVSPGGLRTQTSTKRAIARAVKEVAHYLGNTPAVARSSYIDPRVFDRFRSGWTIGGALQAVADAPGEFVLHHPAVEGAVLDLLSDDVDPRESDGLMPVETPLAA